MFFICFYFHAGQRKDFSDLQTDMEMGGGKSC